MSEPTAPKLQSVPEPSLEVLLASCESHKQAGHHRQGLNVAAEIERRCEGEAQVAIRARALQYSGLLHFRLGEYEFAVTACQSAVDLHQHLPSAALTEALATQIMAYIELGLHEEALQTVDECLTVAQRSGDELQMSWALNRAGCANDAIGNHESATGFLSQALDLAERAGAEEAIFAALNNLAENTLDLAEDYRRKQRNALSQALLSRGLEICERAVSVAKASGNLHRLALSQGNFGMMLALAGQHARAELLFKEAWSLCEQHDYRPVQRVVRRYQGRTQLLRGRLDAGIELLEQTLAQAEAGDDRNLALTLMREITAAYKQSERYSEALDMFERFYKVERQRNTQVAALRARMLADRQELDRARLEADRARLEAELLKARSEALAEQNRQLEDQNAVLNMHAHQDALTGVWNRRYLEQRLPQAFTAARQDGQPLSLAILDVDHFKQINDNYGHDVGDEVLRRLAALLKAHCRPTDLLARYGGEEFVLAMPRTSQDVAVHVCNRLRDWIEREDFSDLHVELACTASFGVCGAAGFDDIQDVFRQADRCLYQAKRDGRNRVVEA